jgi:chemotaxis signal transduction protein
VSSAAYLLVRVGERVVALPAEAVRRVVRGARLHPCPGAGPGLVGLAEFAGEPLAVLDLAQLLGDERHRGRPPVTVVTWLGSGNDRELVGLGVDEALEVADIDPVALGFGEAELGGRAVAGVDLDLLGVEA